MEEVERRRRSTDMRVRKLWEGRGGGRGGAGGGRGGE